MLSLLDFRIHVSSQPCLVWYLHNDRSNVYRQVLENMVLWWITRQHGSIVVFLVWVSLWMVYGSIDRSIDGWMGVVTRTKARFLNRLFFPPFWLCVYQTIGPFWWQLLWKNPKRCWTFPWRCFLSTLSCVSCTTGFHLHGIGTLFISLLPLWWFCWENICVPDEKWKTYHSWHSKSQNTKTNKQ